MSAAALRDLVIGTVVAAIVWRATDALIDRWLGAT